MTSYKRDHSLTRYVLNRDCRICQCCYDTRHLDVHHIHPLYLGGADHPDNMITLCTVCHRWAPDDCVLFLKYQREGGASTKFMIAQIVIDMAGNPYPLTVRELYDHVEAHRLQEFERAWDTYHNEVNLKSRKVRQKEIDSGDILQVLSGAPEFWFTVRELRQSLTDKKDSQIYAGLSALVAGGLVRKKIIERAGYFQVITD